MKVKLLSRVRLLATAWTAAYQAPPSMGFSRQDENLLILRSKAQLAAAPAKSLQSCPTLCNPIDGSPPGSPVPGILQARTLEWGAIGKFNLEHHRAQEWQGRNSSAGMSDFKAMLILSLSSEM